MNFLDAMLRGNRNQNNSSEGSKKKAASGSVSVVPSSPSTSTSRHPQGTSGFGSSSSSLVSEGSESISSQSGNPRYGSGTRSDREMSRAAPPRLSRTERSHTVSSVRDRVTPTRTASSERLTSGLQQEQDLYARNELASFSFGIATSKTPLAPSIDPLSPHDDPDYEDFQLKSDITPRPSVAGPSSQRPGAGSLPPHAFVVPSMSPERRRRTSNSSTNTFGTSSASASATSLSSNPVGSRHGGFITTPQTSSNEYTSDDDLSEHRHPIHNFSRNSPTSTLESYSEEEFDDDYDDDRSEPEIDVSSEIHEDFGNFTSYNRSQRSIASSAFSRKRSLAVPIPSSSPEARDREDSLATLRRPSRSLEGLRSNSLEQSNQRVSQDNRPSPVSPTSMPESEVDWRDLRRRSIQRDKERAGKSAGESHYVPEIAPTSGATVTGAPPPTQSSVTEGFDSTWANSAGGIVDFGWEDPSEMADIVGGFHGPSSSSHRNFRRDSSSSSITSGRRSSISSDPFTRHLKASGGQHYADERAKWIFTLDPNGLHEARGGHERERSSISSVLGGGRSSFSSSSMIGSSAGFHEAIAPFATGGERRWGGKDKNKEVVWKGMTPESEECWTSGTNGRYKVVRKNQTAEGKAPQQRLHITHHRNNPYSQKFDKSDGPSITIHKHSKAVAFSISRHYRPKAALEMVGRSAPPSARTIRVPMPVDRRRPSPMILLASRKVQEAYTSTNTTRKLEAHGLLSTNGRPSSRDRERLARFQKEDEERARQQKKEQKKQEKSKAKGKGKDKSTQPSMSDLTAVASSSDSSNGSVNTDSQPGPSTTPAIEPHTNRPSMDQSVKSQDTVSSGRTITYQRRESEVLLSDEDDEFRPRQPSKTPHTETYATLPPEVLESIAHNESHGGGLWGWGKKSTNLFQRQVQSAYKPPWAISQPRYHDRKGIVEDLNTSFQDVGLLPAVDEVRASQKRKQRQQEARNMAKTLNLPEPDNVFTSFSSELLYMLLPLWPGETDAQADSKTPFAMPHIPVEKRLYLLVHYTPEASAPPQEDKGKKASKKSSRGSPTSSRDSVRVEKSILFQRFHFSARIVTYGDIQGSGVRSPDAGLSVIGPLQEAYETMPNSKFVDTEFIMIGWSQSRNRGVEFIPEGLEKLGLAKRELDPNAPPPLEDDASGFPKSSEDQEEPATIHVLTPIGRAVVEMAWLGSMALTSFG